MVKVIQGSPALTDLERTALVGAVKNLGNLMGESELSLPSAQISELEKAILRSLEKSYIDPPLGLSIDYSAPAPDRLGWITARPKRQLAYSIKFSNFLRDPFMSSNAALMSLFGANYALKVADKLPITFPMFVVGLGFTVLRAFAQTIGYGEAALLHEIAELADYQGFVPSSAVVGLGPTLVSKYQYVKGNNTNEIAALLVSLVNWNSIEEAKGGYKIREAVLFLGKPKEQ